MVASSAACIDPEPEKREGRASRVCIDRDSNSAAHASMTLRAARRALHAIRRRQPCKQRTGSGPNYSRITATVACVPEALLKLYLQSRLISEKKKEEKRKSGTQGKTLLSSKALCTVGRITVAVTPWRNEQRGVLITATRTPPTEPWKAVPAAKDRPPGSFKGHAGSIPGRCSPKESRARMAAAVQVVVHRLETRDYRIIRDFHAHRARQGWA